LRDDVRIYDVTSIIRKNDVGARPHFKSDFITAADILYYSLTIFHYTFFFVHTM